MRLEQLPSASATRTAQHSPQLAKGLIPAASPRRQQEETVRPHPRNHGHTTERAHDPATARAVITVRQAARQLLTAAPIVRRLRRPRLSHRSVQRRTTQMYEKDRILPMLITNSLRRRSVITKRRHRPYHLKPDRPRQRRPPISIPVPQLRLRVNSYNGHFTPPRARARPRAGSAHDLARPLTESQPDAR
jgi:hypothetical protein